MRKRETVDFENENRKRRRHLARNAPRPRIVILSQAKDLQLFQAGENRKGSAGISLKGQRSSFPISA